MFSHTDGRVDMLDLLLCSFSMMWLDYGCVHCQSGPGCGCFDLVGSTHASGWSLVWNSSSSCIWDLLSTTASSPWSRNVDTYVLIRLIEVAASWPLQPYRPTLSTESAVLQALLILALMSVLLYLLSTRGLDVETGQLL